LRVQRLDAGSPPLLPDKFRGLIKVSSDPNGALPEVDEVPLRHRLVQSMGAMSKEAAEKVDMALRVEVHEPSIYIDLVMQSYARELKKKTLKLNTNIPRIAKRVELALRELDIEFHKTRPARLFLTQMATTAENLIDVGTRERFEKLFGTLNDRFATARAKRAM
jgi:ssDNA-specific exonuclease RecJ